MCVDAGRTLPRGVLREYPPGTTIKAGGPVEVQLGDMNRTPAEQRAWAERNRRFARWMKSFRAGRSLHRLSPRERFKHLIYEVEFVDRFGVPDSHWIPRYPGQRLRVGGRRLGMTGAAWAIFRGRLDSAYTPRSTCGTKLCCAPDHLKLELR